MHRETEIPKGKLPSYKGEIWENTGSKSLPWCMDISDFQVTLTPQAPSQTQGAKFPL